MKILKAEGKNSQLVTPFKKKETIVEKTLMSYLVNHVYCLSCEFQTWTFDISSDIILNIDEEADRYYARRSMRYSYLGRKLMRDEAESANKNEKWGTEKDAASDKLDSKIEADGKKCQNGNYEINLEAFEDNLIPNFDKSKDKLFTPNHVIPNENESREITLEGLLEGYFKTNLLNNKDNYYTCEKCRKTVDMEKNIMFITSTYRLYDMPPNIAISLKRFRQSSTSFSFFGRGGGGFSKINTDVKFPFNIDFTPYVMSKCYCSHFNHFI